jgi:hypothetical protein
VVRCGLGSAGLQPRRTRVVRLAATVAAALAVAGARVALPCHNGGWGMRGTPSILAHVQCAVAVFAWFAWQPLGL